MRVAFHTLGCKLNSTETMAIQRRFQEQGHAVVDYGTDADVLVINTCTVTEQADVECRKVVRRGLRGAPSAAVVVTGCYAQLQPEEILSIEGVRAVVGTADKLAIADRIDDIMASEEPQNLVRGFDDSTPFVGARSGLSNTRTRAFLKIQDGCDYSCTFCTIPKARGPARAMALNEIREQLIAVAREGYEECVLTGINLGEYRSGTGSERFSDVLAMINGMELPYRVRIGSIEPNTMTADVLEQWLPSNTIVPHLHMPLQSGSAEVLRAMRRRYNPTMYREVVEHFHSSLPDAAIGIDVITGFPAESEEHFQETLEFLESIPWTYLHVFTYSEREDTPASVLPNKVPVNVRRDRTRMLREMSESRTRKYHESQLGSKRVFLPEGYNAEAGAWNGWTENHVACVMKAPFTHPKQRYHVRLLSVQDDRVLVEPLTIAEGEIV